MEIDNAEHNTTNSIIDIETIQKISCRLVIKNIPENLSSAHLYDIFEKNFAENIKDKSLVIKLEKKYSLKKRNKIFFVTANNLQTRDKIYEFFSTFELIDPKGIKQKLVVNDCLMQSKIKGKEDIHLLLVHDQVLDGSGDAIHRLRLSNGLDILVLYRRGEGRRPGHRLCKVTDHRDIFAGFGKGRKHIHQHYKGGKAGGKAHGRAAAKPFES
jgi:hypothetical protein